jgi:hypothetical protein
MCALVRIVPPPLAFALDVKISQPPNPFIGYTHEQFAFVGAATDGAGKDVTADCDWTWYFTTGKGVSGNPVAHAFAKPGEVTVTAAARLKDDSGAAVITGTITTAPPATDSPTGPFMYLKLLDGTRVDPGGSICEMCDVYMELPALYVYGGFWKKPSNSSTWTVMQGSACGQSQHDGKTWYLYHSSGWSTWGEKNWGMDWRGAWTLPHWPPPPLTGYATGTWTVDNTVVSAAPTPVIFDPASDDPAVQTPQITWSISHMDYHPVWDVTVTILGLVDHTVVKTITTQAGLGMGSVTWDGTKDVGGTAPRGIYAFQVTADHRFIDPPVAHYCTDAAFVERFQ